MLRFSLGETIVEKGCRFYKRSCGSGYKVTSNGQCVIIKFVSPLAFFAGFPPLYFFKGKLLQVGENTEVVGRILMVRLSKIFILIWALVVLLTLTLCIAMSVFWAISYMAFPSQHAEHQLLTGGFLVGAIAVLSVFGIVLISLIRLISRSQKVCLKQLCQTIDQQKVT